MAKFRFRGGEDDRLRAFALAYLAGELVGQNEAMVALAEDPDPLGWKPWEATPAIAGQWFLWLDPDEPDRVHADRVEPGADGMIDMKYGCGLAYYPLCQPAVLPPEVTESLAEAEAREAEMEQWRRERDAQRVETTP